MTLHITPTRAADATGWLTQVLSDPDTPDAAKDLAELLVESICADRTVFLPEWAVLDPGMESLYRRNWLQPIRGVQPGSGIAQIGPGW